MKFKEKKFGISVIIPNYNRREQLIRAVDSIYTQELDKVEIIVIDDCSEIDPITFLGQYNKHGLPIRLFKNHKNSGPQVARNLGIRRARFCYVSFLDSDDFFKLEKIDCMFDVIRKENPDFIYHGVDGCEKYNLISRFWHNTIGRFLHFSWLLSLLNPCVTPSVVIRRKICLFNPNLRYSEDYSFYLSYVSFDTKVVYLDSNLSVVPREIGSVGGLSSSIIKMRLGEIYGKWNILRHRSHLRYLIFALSLITSSVRVFTDILRRRYTVSEFIEFFKK
ncbi:glycosyltransferase family 2 protein [Vibrio cholerae]|uniref:glycosyltransferase family 2 protein n=1 Tax=Vibrio cholerae TaxID=666 RepID=UPI000BA97069|nr:glycosyltransferase family 2 protein [Vibrio cholerae]PAS28167.1 hypothetical protein CGT71_15980 [Vibrio cholerae]